MRDRNHWKELSIFQKTSIILIVVLIIAIIIQIGVIIDLKNKIDEKKQKNNDLTSQLPEEESQSTQFWQNIYLKSISNRLF